MSAEGAKIFDSAEAFDRVDGDKELFFELVEMFFEDYEEVLKGIEQAVEKSEAKHLEERAHSVKSALGNLGAMQAFQIAFELENAGREGSFNGVPEKVEQLKHSVDEFRKAADSHR